MDDLALDVTQFATEATLGSDALQRNREEATFDAVELVVLGIIARGTTRMGVASRADTQFAHTADGVNGVVLPMCIFKGR
jgi:hypothetical protein